MAANGFQAAYKLSLISEGGWADDPNDPGGATMRGITIAVYVAYCLRRGRSRPTKADLRAISDADVHAIYYDQYWKPVKGDDLPAGLDYATYDFAIHSGPSKAAKSLQNVLGVRADGAIGEITLDAIKAQLESGKLNALIDKYVDARLSFLRRLPGWKFYAKGWSSRMVSVRKNAKRLAIKAPTIPQADVVQGIKADPRRVSSTETPIGKRLQLIAAGGGAEIVGQAGAQLTGYGEVSTLFSVLAGVLIVAGLYLAFVKLSSSVQTGEYDANEPVKD